MEHSAADSSDVMPRANNLKLWFNLFLLSSVYSLAIVTAYVYFWPNILQLTLSVTTAGTSSGEVILKAFFVVEAILALSVYAYLHVVSKIDLSPRVYLEFICILLALRIIAGIFLGLEFFVSLIPCLVAHTVIYLAAMGKKLPQKSEVPSKNLG